MVPVRVVDPPGPLATLDRAHLLETSPDCLVVLVRDKTLTVRPAVLARPEPVPGRLELDEEDVRTGLTVTEADPALSQLQLRCRSGWKTVQQVLYSCATCCVKCLGPV